MRKNTIYSWESLLGEAIGEDAAMRVICNAAREHWDRISNRSRVAQPVPTKGDRVRQRSR